MFFSVKIIIEFVRFILDIQVSFRVGVMMEITVHFFVLRKKLVSYFASIFKIKGM